MFSSIRARLEAHRLSRQLRKSLATPNDKWKIDADEAGRPTLSHGDFRIVLVPRRARLFDTVHVYRGDAEIWLPLLARLGLRAAARAHLIGDANAHWKEPERRKMRANRRHAKPAV